MITTVTHNPADRLPDGRWEGTIVQKKAPVREIRWAGLYDKNSDKLCASKQIFPWSDYYMRDREIFESCMIRYRKLLDGARLGIMKKIINKNSVLFVNNS